MYFVFYLCWHLKIDDPLAWMDAVGEKMIDRWLAFATLEKNAEANSGSGMVRPEEAHEQLKKRGHV